MADEVIDISSKLSSDESEDGKTAASLSRSLQGSEDKGSRRPPLPDCIYKIVSVNDSRQLMLLHGQLVLASPEELGAPFWACEQHNTWLSFRNVATGRLLGHDSGNPGQIRCEAQNRQHWEQLLVIPHTRIEGAFSILTEYWLGCRAIGLCDETEEPTLCRIKDEHDPGIAWRFLEV